jgi:alpha-tubulin suppressor-like RCC1 family protein
MAGQLGIGDQRIQYSVAPTWVEKLSQIPIVSISCGDCSSLALAADGTLYGWGKNADGQLGRIGDDLLFPKPIKMPEKKRVVSVVSGYKHSLALMEDNEVWSWGQARIGQLGRDDVESNKKTWDITELKERTVVSIFAGAYLSFALCN